MQRFIITTVLATSIAGCGSSAPPNPPPTPPPPPIQGVKVYVAEEDDGSVAVIDAHTNSVLQKVKLAEVANGMTMDFMPHNVQVAPDGKSVWVTAPPMEHPNHMGPEPDEEVVVIDPKTDAISKRHSGCSKPASGNCWSSARTPAPTAWT